MNKNEYSEWFFSSRRRHTRYWSDWSSDVCSSDLGTLEEVRRGHVTNVVGAPPMYVAWSMIPDLSEAFASVRLLVSGAAPLPAHVLSSILERTGQHVFEGYGLTETSPVLTTTLMSEVAKPGSIGRAIPGVELRLLDDAGREVEDDDAGEVTVRGANVFS